MKRILLISIAVLCLLGAPCLTLADSITNTVDFVGQTDSGRTYQVLSGLGTPNGNDPFPFDYTHSIPFVPPATSITNATITLSHKGNNTQNENNEFWIIQGGGAATLIGNLAFSNDAWVDQKFTIPSELYPSLPASSWSLGIRLYENTGGFDDLWIDKSVLAFDYEPGPVSTNTAPVPEPATLLLLGTGLLGVCILRKRTV